MTRLVAFVALVAMCAGCDLIVRPSVDRGCTNNAACTTGICYFGECVEPENDVPINLFAELTPPAAEPYLQQRRVLDVRSGRVTFRWRQPVQWAGRMIGNQTQPRPPAGRLFIRRPDERAVYVSKINEEDRFTAFLEPENVYLGAL